MKSYKTKILCDVTYTFEAATNCDGDYDFFRVDGLIIGNMDLVSHLPEDVLEDLDAAMYEHLKGSDDE